MEELKEILDHSEDRSLLLVDEIASGTNPVEGLALTRSLVDYLKEKQNEARRTEDDALQQQISMGILKLFYLLPYDTKTDFYAQFAARMEAAGKN